MDEPVSDGVLVAAGGAVVRVRMAVFCTDHEGLVVVVDHEGLLVVVVHEGLLVVLVTDDCKLVTGDWELAGVCELVTDDWELVLDGCELVTIDCEFVTDDCGLVDDDTEIVTGDWEPVTEEEFAVKPPGITIPRVLYVPRLKMLRVSVQQLASPPQQYVELEHWKTWQPSPVEA